MAKIYFKNEDCIPVMQRMKETNYKVDLVLTSPPYATSRSTVKTQKAIDEYNRRYDICLDNLTQEEYCNWTVDLFNGFDGILEKDGVVLYNLSYGQENTDTWMLAMADVIRKTNFTLADTIIWKKGSALPNNVSPNKCTRITEFVFVFCRKSEFMTFRMNKGVTSVRPKTGQKYYENVFNFIEAKNNDGACALNKATYSSDLCIKLMLMYAHPGIKVFDPFMGTGTTGIACEIYQDSEGYEGEDMICIGCELSPAQVQYAKDRLANYRASGKITLPAPPKKPRKKKGEEEAAQNEVNKETT